MANDTSDPIWQLAEYLLKDSIVLRLFLKDLCDNCPDPSKKLARIQNWKLEIGLLMGTPPLDKTAILFQKIRNAPPQVQREIVEEFLAKFDEIYLPSP